MMADKIGIIGFGEAGQAVAGGFTEEGNSVAAYDLQYNKYLERAEELQVNLFDNKDEFLKNVNILFSLVPCSVSLAVAEEFIPLLDSRKIFIELSASFPDDMEKASQIADNNGIDFIDGAIMGSVINFKHKVPIFLSGKKSVEISKDLKKMGMNIEVIGDKAGQASASKLCRSIYTKGTEALLVELLKVTEHFDITDTVLNSIDKTWYLNGFRAEAERLFKSTEKHIERKHAEVVNVVKMIKDIGVEAYMYQAAETVLNQKKDNLTK